MQTEQQPEKHNRRAEGVGKSVGMVFLVLGVVAGDGVAAGAEGTLF